MQQFRLREEIETFIHRNLGEDGKSLELNLQNDLKYIVSLAKKAGFKGLRDIEALAAKVDLPELIHVPVNPLDLKHKPDSEAKDEDELSLMTQIILAVKANLLSQLESIKGAVKALEEGLGQELDELSNNQFSNSKISVSPSPKQSMETEEKCWHNYLTDKGLSYSEDGQLLKNQEQIVGSDDMTALRRDYQINYRSDETLGKAAMDVASGQLDNSGDIEENTQQNVARKTPSPFSMEPKPSGFKDT